jgi:hypothetical protein
LPLLQIKGKIMKQKINETFEAKLKREEKEKGKKK